MPDDSEAIAVETAIDDFFPTDWGNSPSRKSQIQAVVHAFLTDTDRSNSIAERRLAAQEMVADREGVEVNTIQSKCGRETWSEYVENVDYQQEYFDSSLKLLEEAYQEDLYQPDDETDVFVMPVSDSWLLDFKRTVDKPTVFGPPESRPDDLAAYSAVRIWGTTTGDRNASTHSSLSSGDIVLFSHDGLVFSYGRIHQRVTSKAAGEYIWESEDSIHIYTLVGYRRLELPQETLWDDFGYDPDFNLRGFKRIKDERVQRIVSQAGDLDSYLDRHSTTKSLNTLISNLEKLSRDAKKQASLDEQSNPDSTDTDYEITTRRAPYYWVNQSDSKELTEEYLQAPVSGQWMHDLGKLEVGDTIFHFTDGQPSVFG